MKNKCKNILKLTLVCFLLILTACETEKDYITSENSNQKYQLKEISFAEFKTNQAAFQKLKEAHSKKNSTLKQKGVYNEDYGVFIDTTNIILVQKENKHSITFQIADEEVINKIQNLVLTSKDDGGYTAYIAEYLLNQQEIQSLKEGEKLENKYPSTITKIDNNSTVNVSESNSGCVYSYYATRYYCRNAAGETIRTSGDLGDGCVGTSWEETTLIIDIDLGCGGSNSGSGYSGGGLNGGGTNTAGSSGSSNNGNTGNPSDGSGNNSGHDDPVFTTPVLDINAFKKFVLGLTNEQRDWLNDPLNSNIKLSFESYINQHPNKEVASQFVMELINFSINNNIEINSNFILENLNNFSNFIELEQFINYEVNSDVVSNSNLFENDKIITTRKVSVTSLHELTLEIVITPNPNFSLDENNSTSFFSSDLLPGNSWTQTSIIVTNENFSQTSAEITISGYINIGVKVGDYVMGVKKRKQIKIRINKNNGNIWYSEVKNLN